MARNSGGLIRAALLLAAALVGLKIGALAAAKLLHTYGAVPPEVASPTLKDQLHEFVAAWTIQPLTAAFIAVLVAIVLLVPFARSLGFTKHSGLEASLKRSEILAGFLAAVLAYVALAPNSVTSLATSSVASWMDAAWSRLLPDKAARFGPVETEASKLREAGLASPLCEVELDPRPSLVTKICNFPSEQRPLYAYAAWKPRGVGDEWRPKLTFYAVPAGYAQLRRELSSRGVSGRTTSRCLRGTYVEQEIGNSMHLSCGIQPDGRVLVVEMSCGIIYDFTAQPTCVPIRRPYE
jgi:hypothetical protein